MNKYEGQKQQEKNIEKSNYIKYKKYFDAIHLTFLRLLYVYIMFIFQIILFMKIVLN